MSSRRLGPARAYAAGMLLGVRFIAVCAACVFSTQLAHAQGTDTLPTLDDSAPPTATPQPEPVEPQPSVVVIDPSQRPVHHATGPIRAQRRLALLGEVGWNGIAGFGPNLTFRAHPNVSFDLGAGVGLVGWKVALRARYLFLKGPVTPFIGVGVMAASGLGSDPVDLSDKNDDPSREPLQAKIMPSTWLQSVAGVDWVAARGFTMIGAVGWASVLGDDPVQITSGTPTHEEQQMLNAFFRSSVVITVAIGYSFR